MMTLPDLFSVCIPRRDVVEGSLKDASLAADLAQVIKREAPPEYNIRTRWIFCVVIL